MRSLPSRHETLQIPKFSISAHLCSISLRFSKYFVRNYYCENDERQRPFLKVLRILMGLGLRLGSGTEMKLCKGRLKIIHF